MQPNCARKTEDSESISVVDSERSGKMNSVWEIAINGNVAFRSLKVMDIHLRVLEILSCEMGHFLRITN